MRQDPPWRGREPPPHQSNLCSPQEDLMPKYLRTLSTLWALALAGVLCASAGPAQAAVYVRIAPPASQAEVVGPPPGPGHTWTNGYHRWDGREYTWRPGRWVRPPHP